MRPLLCKRSIGGFVLATLAAGTWSVPSVAVQNSGKSTTKTTHKTSSSKGAHLASSSASASKPPTKTTVKRSSRKRTKKVKGQTAPTTDRISQIQEALSKKGLYSGPPTGQWDDSTVNAMKKFQASSGLPPSGKLDALSLQKLGLGSETAGLAAPTPPPNSANRLRNQSSAPAEIQAEPQN
jgi:peptidoglycan hydrolase-like protein with peptidoglycan-binding domain